VRFRYNAAKIVQTHLDRHESCDWAATTLVKLLDSGTVDGSDSSSDPAAEFPLGDKEDAHCCPTDDICRTLGRIRSREATEPLIRLLRRRPYSSQAVVALGEIGDPAAIPVLLERFEASSSLPANEVAALGKLKVRQIVPKIAPLLNGPNGDSGLSYDQTKVILDALRDIGDRSAAPSIEKFYARTRRVDAKRVLLQLTEPDPVPALIEFFDGNSDDYAYVDVLEDLCRFDDPRVTQFLKTIAANAPSETLRLTAIRGLGSLHRQDALMALVGLFAVRYPPTMDVRVGPGPAIKASDYFPDLIRRTLMDATGQDFGRDADAWARCLAAHPVPARDHPTTSPSGA
jgi:HEAT repeat protein